MADMTDVDTMVEGDVRCVNAVWWMKREARDGLAFESGQPSRPLWSNPDCSERGGRRGEVGIDASRQSTFGLNRITRTHESASCVATDSLNAIRGWFAATRLHTGGGYGWTRAIVDRRSCDGIEGLSGIRVVVTTMWLFSSQDSLSEPVIGDFETRSVGIAGWEGRSDPGMWCFAFDDPLSPGSLADTQQAKECMWW